MLRKLSCLTICIEAEGIKRQAWTIQQADMTCPAPFVPSELAVQPGITAHHALAQRSGSLALPAKSKREKLHAPASSQTAAPLSGRMGGSSTRRRAANLDLWDGLWDKSICSININKYQILMDFLGGQRGIRTLERLSPLHTFQACAFNHSATCPHWETGNTRLGPPPQVLAKFLTQKAF